MKNMVIMNDYTWNINREMRSIKKEEPSINFRTENYNIWNFKFPKLNNRMEMRKEAVKLKIDKGKLSILKKKKEKDWK